MSTHGLERQSAEGRDAATSAFALPTGTNLLPNGSFELGGYYQFDGYWQRPTGWGEFYNPLTLGLVYLRQHPKRLPAAGRFPEVPHGRQCAQVPLEQDEQDEWRGHLTSPMIQVKPGQAYVLSLSARSDVAGAKLRPRLWTRPLDWKEPEDRDYFDYHETNSAPQGEEVEVNHGWQRYEFPLMILSWRENSVVDIAVSGEEAGDVMIDEVQLEEGSRATPFQARHQVEAAIEDRRGQQMCKLFRMDEPLTLHLPIYNNAATAHTGGIVIVVERMDGSTVLEEAMTDPIPPGHSEVVFARDFGLVGDFVARVFVPDGAEIGANRYQFRSVPVIPENAQFIIVSRAGAAEQVPAERVWLPWNNEENWYADPPQGLTITDAGNIYVAFDKNRLLKTRDGGRSWEALPATRQALGVCRDGTLINVDREREGESLSVYRSADEGESWVLAGVLGRKDSYCETVTELGDGTLVTVLPADPNRCHRSTDGGKTWSPGFPVCPGGEAHITELQSGRLLCVARYRPPMPRYQWDMWLQYPSSLWWFTRGGSGGYGSHLKCVLLADSDDGGKTWSNVRRGTFIMETMHGSAVQLPDGRLVLLHVSRAVSPGGGTWAKVSSDEGKSWDVERYYMNASPAYAGYSASCVLPPHLADGDPGMILTVAGERARGDYPARAQAVRWRPL